jgi:RNA polymerase primary sigma factor
MNASLDCEGRNGLAHAPLETYLREIDNTRLLSAEEERQLAYRVGTGDCEARDHLVRANLRLVVHIARSYLGKGLGLEDLIEEGNLGLLRAVEGFNPSMNTRFSTYASFWIKQSIKRGIINSAKTIRLPAYVNDLMTKWRRATAELQEILGRPPQQEEVARRLNLSKKKFAIVKQAIRIHNCSPQTEQEESPHSLEDMCPDSDTQGPLLDMVAMDDVRRVLGLLDKMAPRDATVLRLRFGLDGEEPRTLKEIGEHLGLTRERVRQIERTALDELREALEA